VKAPAMPEPIPAPQGTPEPTILSPPQPETPSMKRQPTPAQPVQPPAQELHPVQPQSLQLQAPQPHSMQSPPMPAVGAIPATAPPRGAAVEDAQPVSFNAPVNPSTPRKLPPVNDSRDDAPSPPRWPNRFDPPPAWGQVNQGPGAGAAPATYENRALPYPTVLQGQSAVR
jgi:hypothetical protein